jgi:hypothetical protein
VAYVPAGDEQQERAFNQQGEDTSIVRADGRPGRRGAKWFSYDVRVDASQAVALVVTYNSDNRRARSFEIVVDGRRIGEQHFEQNSESRFFDVEYRLPDDLARGKEQVTVRFQALSGNDIAPVFGIRSIHVPAAR